MQTNKYILTIGIHRGTITSRDTQGAKYFDTYAQAYQEYLMDKYYYNTHGKVIWFANITSPEGITTQVEGNSNYK